MQNKNRKNKKLTKGEGFTLASEAPLGLSLGALIGASCEKPGCVQSGCKAGENLDTSSASGAPQTSETEAQRQACGAEKKPQGKSAPAAAQSPKISKVSLQRQRAGRGGKTVTLVVLPQDYKGDAAALAKELRKGLGCGSTIEEGKIVLQGDITERVEAWFAKKGVTKITKSA